MTTSIVLISIFNLVILGLYYTIIIRYNLKRVDKQIMELYNRTDRINARQSHIIVRMNKLESNYTPRDYTKL